MEKIINFIIGIYIFGMYFFSNREGYTYITNSVGMVLVAMILLKFLLKKENIRISKAHKHIFLFMIIIILSYFISIDPNNTLITIKTITLNIIMILVLYQYLDNLDKIRSVLKFLVFSGFIVTLNMLTELKKVEYYTRIGSELGNVNRIGVLLIISLAISLYIGTSEKKLIYICMSLVIFIGVLLTGSKTAFLGVLLTIILFIINSNMDIKRKISLSILAIIGIIFIIFLIMNNEIFYSILGRRIEKSLGINGMTVDDSTIIRYQMLVDGINFFEKNPILGNGLDSYRILSQYATYSHNNFIELLVGIGIVGFISYYKMFYLAYSFRNKTQYSNLFNTLIIVFFVLSISSVQYLQKYMYLIILLGMSNQTIHSNRR